MFCGMASLMAQSKMAERLFLVTDRSSYVAGEEVLVSAFCFDAASGRLSDCSRVAYVELVSAEGGVKFSKLSMDGGRGAGAFTIPATVPTGNYRIVAYTAQNKLENGYDYLECSRIISVFNTLSTERVQDGVKLMSSSDYRAQLASARSAVTSGFIGMSLSENVKMGAVVPVALNNKSGKPLSYSVSIHHADGVAAADARSIVDAKSDFSRPGSVSEGDSDIEGEVIHASLVGANFDLAQRNTLVGVIAVPSGEMYAADIKTNGEMTFHTLNIYGEHLDMVAEVAGLEDNETAHIELESPFVGVEAGELPQLALSDYLYERLLERSANMQLRRKCPSDTLYNLLPKRPDPLFRGVTPRKFILDDYVRFPSMHELFVEIIPEVRGRQSKKRGTTISVLLDDDRGRAVNAWGNSLMMIDGVPVLDHARVWDYDPYLIDTVAVYRNTFSIGDIKFGGIVNFKTFKKNMPGVVFDDSVRITDWSGVTFPVSFTLPYIYGQDLRQTIWWHPLCELPAGGSQTIRVCVPEYQGDFVVEINGVAADGEAFHETARFSVR